MECIFKFDHESQTGDLIYAFEVAGFDAYEEIIDGKYAIVVKPSDVRIKEKI